MADAITFDAVEWRRQAAVMVHYEDFRDRKGSDISEWPEDLRVQEFPR